MSCMAGGQCTLLENTYRWLSTEYSVSFDPPDLAAALVQLGEINGVQLGCTKRRWWTSCLDRVQVLRMHHLLDERSRRNMCTIARTGACRLPAIVSNSKIERGLPVLFDTPYRLKLESLGNCQSATRLTIDNLTCIVQVRTRLNVTNPCPCWFHEPWSHEGKLVGNWCPLSIGLLGLPRGSRARAGAKPCLLTIMKPRTTVSCRHGWAESQHLPFSSPYVI